MYVSMYCIAFQTFSKSSIGNVSLIPFKKQKTEFHGYTPESAELSLQFGTKPGTEHFKAFLHKWTIIRVWFGLVTGAHRIFSICD